MPKGQVTEKSVEELMAGFAVAPSSTTSPAELRRREISTGAEAFFGNAAKTIVSRTEGAEDTASIKGALQSLLTAKQRTLKAIKSIPDEVLLNAAAEEDYKESVANPEQDVSGFQPDAA